MEARSAGVDGSSFSRRELRSLTLQVEDRRHEPRNLDILEKLDKARKWILFSLRVCKRSATLPTP